MAFIKRGSQTELPARDWLGWSRPLSRSFQGHRQALRQCSKCWEMIADNRLREVVVSCRTAPATAFRRCRCGRCAPSDL